MEEIVPKRDIWSRYGTKSAAADCKQAETMMKDGRVSRWFFSNILHKLFGNIDAIT